MSPTLAIIPAKRHSSQVPDKNWKPIAPDGRNCVDLAVRTAYAAHVDQVVLSTDVGLPELLTLTAMTGTVIQRPDGLPDAMIDVVRHALECVPGPDDEIIVLLQPTSPLRTAETVKKAIALLEEDARATSVVSVCPTYPREWTLTVDGAYLRALDMDAWEPEEAFSGTLNVMPARRQDCQPSYKRDGVVYAFRRRTAKLGNIYGWYALPLHTPPEESLSIDTPADWDEAVRRLSTTLGV